MTSTVVYLRVATLSDLMPDEVDPELTRFAAWTMDERSTVWLRCENGHVSGCRSHAIDPAGRVSPSLVCPHAGCDSHVFGVLANWPNALAKEAKTEHAYRWAP